MQPRQQDDFAIGKFKSVMMNVRLAFVDLLKLRYLVPGAPGAVFLPVAASVTAVEVVIQARSYHGEILVLLQHKRLVTGNEMRVVGTEVVK